MSLPPGFPFLKGSLSVFSPELFSISCLPPPCISFFQFNSSLLITKCWSKQSETWQFTKWVCITITIHRLLPPPPGGGGGTSILKVSGTCRWTGYDFAIIAIKTGCLNQPNHWHRVSKSAYLATGTDYSVYHRVVSRPQCLWQVRDLGTDATRRCMRAGPVFQRSLIFFFMNGS